MHLRFAIIAMGLALPGAAQASSFVSIAPPPPGRSPSVVTLGAPPAPVKLASAQPKPASRTADASLVPLAFPLPDGKAPAPRVISPSIVAYGPTTPAVTFEQVASIQPHAFRAPQSTPIVMRAGITDAPQPAVAIAPAQPGKLAGKTGRAQPGTGKIAQAKSGTTIAPAAKVTAKAPPRQPDPTPAAPTPGPIAPPREMPAPQ